MAGAGYKLFNTGDVLTAAQVNTYLQEQVVMVFADAAARTTALSGVLAEGMVSYLKDTDALEIYSGSAWVGYGSGDITGITTGATSGLTGGVTSGTADLKLNTTAKGGLLVGTGSGTVTELAVGSNNTVLTADSSTASGLKWASASSGGGMTLLSTTTLSGTSTSISISPSGYQDLQIYLKDFRWNSDASFSFTLNNDTTTYNYIGMIAFYRNVAGNSGTTGSGDDRVNMNWYDWAGGNNDNAGVIEIYDVNNTATGKAGIVTIGGHATGGANYRMSHMQSFAWLNTAAVSSIQLKSNTTFQGGTVEIYGVK